MVLRDVSFEMVEFAYTFVSVRISYVRPIRKRLTTRFTHVVFGSGGRKATVKLKGNRRRHPLKKKKKPRQPSQNDVRSTLDKRFLR